MKPFYFILICSLVFSFANSQGKKFVFKLGDEYEMPRKSEDLSFIGNKKDGIVNLSLRKGELSILRFDPNNLSLTSDEQIVLEDATSNMNSELVVTFGDKNYWLRSDWDKKNEQEMLYSSKLDIKGGKIGQQQLLIQSDKIASGSFTGKGFYSFKGTNKYNYNYDAAHKLLVITYRLYPEQRNDKLNYDKIGMAVFNENMERVWTNTFTMPYTEAIMDNSDYTVNADGSVYMLAKVYASEKRQEVDKATMEPGYHYEVLRFSKEGKKPLTAAIPVMSNFIREAFIVESSSRELLVACTYSRIAKGNSIDGIYLSRINADGKVFNYKNGAYPFDFEEMTKYESGKYKRRIEKAGEISNMKVRSVIVNPEGDMMIACEKFYYVVKTTTSNNHTSTSTTYYYEDIIAAHITADGVMDWMRKVPKKQLGVNENSTLGFKLIADSTGYYFLFLDNIKNQNLGENDKPKYHQNGLGGQVLVTRIDKFGEMSNEIVFDTREEDIMIFPRDFTKINENQFIGRAKIKKKLYQPLLITMK
jgi:hypothetical protein